MAAGLDGDVKIGLDLQTKSASNALDSFRKKVKDGLSGQDAKGLDQTIKNTEKTIKSLETSIEKTKQKLKEINSQDVTPKSVQSLEKEMEKAYKDAENLGRKLEELQLRREGAASKGTDIPTKKTPVEYGGKFYSGKDAAALKQLDAQIQDVTRRFEEADQKAMDLAFKLDELKANPQSTEEAKKLNNELDETTKELEKQKQKYSELKQEQQNFTSTAVPGTQAVNNALKRVGTMIKKVFVFGVILKGLRSVASALTSVISTNAQFSSSLNEIRGNLYTAVAPIYNALIPAFLTIINVIKIATQYLAQFIALLTGTSISANKKAAKAMYGAANAAKASGGASKKAAKDTKEAAEETEKSTLAFDELNTIASPDKDKDADAADTGGGGGGGGVSPFQTSDLTITEEIKKRLQAILVLIATIGGALLAWKITMFIKDLMAAEEKLKLFQTGFGKVIGIAMIVAGAILLIKNYCDAWVNGLDWGNFLGIIAGLALVVGGLVLVLGASVAPFALIGAGLAAIVLGIKDFIENGATLQNVLLIIIGLAALFAAAWILAGAPIALIVVAIAALVAIFVLLWNKCEGFREFWIGLWEKIKQTATDLWENTLKPIWEDHLKPALEEIWKKIQELWDKVILPVIKWIGEKIEWLWNNVLKPVIDWVVGVFVKMFQNAWDNIKQAIDIAAQFISGIIDSIKDIFTGIIDFIVGVFTGDWKRAWEGLKNVFKGIINGIITIFEGMINFVINGINKFIGGLDAVVSKVGEIFGADWSVATIPTVSLPRLAQGAVLPPNKPFAAIVGDQKQGTNIEAPLDTIVEAMLIALSKTNGGNANEININFTGNLAQLARVLKPAIDKESTRKGVKLVTGGAY